MISHRARRSRGFTIMEILIVVVIISLLAALAIPSYREYVVRTDRTIAKVALVDLVSRQESYALDHKRYSVDFPGLGVPFSGAVYVDRQGAFSETFATGVYSLSLHDVSAIDMSNCAPSSAAPPTARGFAIVAFPTGDIITGPQSGLRHKDEACGMLCINSRGERGSQRGTDCWRR